MYSRVSTLCLILTFLITNAFAEPEKPTATFSADVTEGYAPLHVQFTSETTGDPTSYFWTFEPQTSSDWNSHHPVSAKHTFQNPGVYDISLLVTNSAGSSTVTKPQYITVLAPSTPTPSDTPNPTPTDTSNPTSSDTSNPTPKDTLNPAPTDTSDPISTPTKTQRPVTSFITDVKNGNVPLVVTFTDTSTGSEPTSRYWNFGDGASSAGGPTVTHSYTNPGTYTVALTVTNDAGSDMASKIKYITVAEAPTYNQASSSTRQPVQSSNQPEINLYCTKTAVSVGEEIQSTLSVTSLNDALPMHAQFILTPPSGTIVTSHEFVDSGAGQCTSTFDLQPGEEKAIGMQIKPTQTGNLIIKGRVHYYFEDNKKDSEDFPLDIQIQASNPQQPPKQTPEHLPDLGIGATIFILFIVTFFRRK